LSVCLSVFVFFFFFFSTNNVLDFYSPSLLFAQEICTVML